MIKGKTPEEIRKLFNIQNDFTPEEEAQIRKENVRIWRLFVLFAPSLTRFLTGMGRGPLNALVHESCVLCNLDIPRLPEKKE